MKAAVNTKYGAPEKVIEITQIAKPICGADQVLVKVHYSSVNRTDCGFVRANPFVTRFFSGLFKPRHIVLGCEYSGTIDTVGAAVTEFKRGDKVFGFDDGLWGGHGEYKRAKASGMITKIPKGIDFKTAAVSGEGSHYALSYVQTIKKLGAKKVFVYGATGAIGSAAVQLLKHEGFYVVATSTTKNVQLVKKLGANKVIDHEKQDFTKYPEQFDIVFDAVGKSTFKACKPLLKKQGMYIATELGPKAQNIGLALLGPLYKLFGAKRVLFPLPKASIQIITYLSDRLADKTFTPVIDREFSLENIVKAYNYVETGQKTGNVLIKINNK